jgi:hypothetical protein
MVARLLWLAAYGVFAAVVLLVGWNEALAVYRTSLGSADKAIVYSVVLASVPGLVWAILRLPVSDEQADAPAGKTPAK